jgi:hypothetical protein
MHSDLMRWFLSSQTIRVFPSFDAAMPNGASNNADLKSPSLKPLAPFGDPQRRWEIAFMLVRDFN